MSIHLKILGIGLGVTLLTLLFCGYYLDSNDGEFSVFVKHKPTFKQIFFSPKMHLRYVPRKLTNEEELEELAFQKFIINENNFGKNETSILFIIQLSLTTILFSLYGIIKKRKIKAWQLLSHYTINIFFTGCCFVTILLEGRVSNFILYSIPILLFNLFTIRILNMRIFAREKSTANT